MTDSVPARFGILFIMLFLLLANANAVFSGNLLQVFHPFTFLFWSFFITSIFFHTCLFYRSFLRELVLSRNDMVPLLIVNITSAFNWIGFFFALKYLEPAVVTAIMGGLGPLSTLMLERIVRKHRLPAYAYVVALGVLIGTLMLVLSSILGLAGVRAQSHSITIIGLFAASAAGASQALNTIATKQLGELKWNSTRIMAQRFYLLLLIAAVLAWTGPSFSVSSAGNAGSLLLATVFGVIVPLWILQKGIILSEPFTVAGMLSLAPILTYAFQVFDARIHFSTISGLGCVVIVTATGFNIYMKYRKDLKKDMLSFPPTDSH
ncbi:MAG: DMT family transporter [Halomonas sp.]|nr:DMT family transporter [Halomonas sp.]TVP49264.1 MAG: DMT family transporter [Halomonas sp.]